MKPVIFLPDAEAEMIEAARFYESRASGLGHALLDCVDRGVADIREYPRRWPLIRGRVRRRLIRRFPYGILYREDENEIVIIAIMDLRRHPDYWTRREQK
jgi:plasmid stabilization system protein ParE